MAAAVMVATLAMVAPLRLADALGALPASHRVTGAASAAAVLAVRTVVDMLVSSSRPRVRGVEAEDSHGYCLDKDEVSDFLHRLWSMNRGCSGVQPSNDAVSRVVPVAGREVVFCTW
jgi:hypothetical protein